MTPLRFRVQTRNPGEPWRTTTVEAERAIADHRATQLAEQRDLAGFAMYPFVRIQHGDYTVGLWQYGQQMLAPKAVAS